MPGTNAARQREDAAAAGFDPTPAALVVDGRFQFGTFADALADVNPLDAFARWQRSLQSLRLKEWQAFQAMDAAYFVVGAVYATKIIDLLQLIVVEKKTGRMWKWQRRVAPFQLQLAQGLTGTTSTGQAGGIGITVRNDVPSGTLGIEARGKPHGDRPMVTLRLEGRCAPQGNDHLVICHPFPNGKALYSHKCMMPCTGMLQLGQEAHAFDATQSVVILDDHKGFYPLPMRYDWLTAAGRDSRGDVIGFNLTANQICDPDRYNENALWLGGSVERLPAVRFQRPRGVYGTWEIRDRDGRVNVRFSPSVRNEMHVGPLSVLAEYYGPFGWVEGTVTRANGSIVHLDGLFAMGEQKLVRM